MSYDFTLFRVPAGANAGQVFEELMDEEERLAEDIDGWMSRPIADSVQAEMRKTAEIIKAWRPALEEFRPDKLLPWIELNDEDLAIQFSIRETHVSITMPYLAIRVRK